MRQHITRLIKNKGAITIDTFINEALFHPKYGYYNKKNPLGKKGDFITAPEISQTFGELIAAYLVNLWQNNYHQCPINLVEMGAGRGTLMRDFLRFALKIPNFANKVKINIIEISPKLQTIQKKSLEFYNNVNISWWNNFNDFYQQNQNKPLFFIANELFDCFAVNQFVKGQSGWGEKLITLNRDGKLEFTLSNYNPLIQRSIIELILQNTALTKEQIEQIEQNAIFEYSALATALMQELSLAIRNSKGIGLIIDYGYIESDFQSSLQTVKNHQFHQLFTDIGDSDITALVNFYSLQNIARKSHLATSLISQKEFLESLGIHARKKQLIAGKTPKQQQEIISAINRLTDFEQMGELFKCLILWKE